MNLKRTPYGVIRCFVALPLALLVSCAGIKGEQLTAESLDQVAVAVHQSSLSDHEKALFDEMKARADNGEYDVTGKSVGQAIADQGAYDADQQAQEQKQQALAAAARERHDKSIAAMRSVLVVALVQKSFHDADFENGEYQSTIQCEFAFRNTGAKTIKAVKGTADFDNLLGDRIYSTGIEQAITVPPGQMVTWIGSIDFSEFDQSLVTLRNTDMPQLRFHFIPSTVLFTDGTRLEEEN